jgi:hypothetical protein
MNALIAKLEAAVGGSVDLDVEIARALGWQCWTLIPNDDNWYGLNWGDENNNPKGDAPSWHLTTSIDAALQLLPSTATNKHLFSYGDHGRNDIEGDCWGFQCHDRAQLMGEEHADRHVKNLKISFVVLRKSIHYCEFSSRHAATAALAICITALKVRSGRITDDDLWPMC